jgi:hypothetical protein
MLAWITAGVGILKLRSGRETSQKATWICAKIGSTVSGRGMKNISHS